MELRQLATFRQLAITLNFTRTAVMLNYAQSNVTAQIQSLEEELGVRLFDRLGKHVALTEAGERLLRYAEQIVDLSNEMYAVASTKEEPRGTLSVCATEPLCTYLLPKLFHRLHSRYPQVRIQFRPTDGEDACQLVNEGVVDVALALQEPIRSTKLVVKPLFPEVLYIIAAPWHPLAHTKELQLADFEDETILLPEFRCSYRSLFEHALASAGVQPAAILEVATVEAIKQCVMAGMGVALLPAMATKAEVEQDQLCVIPWTLPTGQLMTQMVWHKEKWISPALQAFIDMTANIEWSPDTV